MKKLLLLFGVLVAFTAIGQTPFGSKLYRQQGVLKTDVWFKGPNGVVVVIPGVPVTDSTNVVVNPPACPTCPTCPECPQPPSNVVQVNPGTGTIAKALQGILPGTKITLKLAAGTYIERGLAIPLGVNIEGVPGTIIKADPSFYNSSRGDDLRLMLIQALSATWSAGDQTFKNFTIDGDGKKLYGGIAVSYRTGVVIDGVTVQNCGYTGIWLHPAKDDKVLNTTITNSGWGNSSADRGNLMISDADNVEVANLTINAGTNYGIKFYPGTHEGSSVYLKNLNIHDSKINTPARGTWNNGAAPAFVFEVWCNDFTGVEMYNNQFNNGISVVNTVTVAGDDAKKLKIYNNTFDLAAAGAYNEVSASNVEFYGNYVNGGTNGFKSTGKQINNWFVHHNTFYNLNAGAYPAGIISIEKGPVPSRNIVVTNNTVEQSNASTMCLFAVGGNQSGMRVESLTIKDNLFINNTAQGQYGQNKFVDLRNGATMSGTVTNNFGQNVNSAGCTGCYSGDPQVEKVNPKPSPYYKPKAGSPVINKGTDGKNIGAY